MQLRVLGCAGGSAPHLRLSSYLIDGVFAIDAGALTTGLEVEGQRAVQAVAFTHGHLDHVWSLPLYLANRFGGAEETCRLHASSYTIETIVQNLFNDRIWPDFTAAFIEGRPLLSWHPIEPGETSTVLDRYEIRAVELNHTVPCQGYFVRRDDRSVLVCGDTSNTDEVWQMANETDDLKGILIECSWTDDLHDLAQKSLHMCPSMLAEDLAKLTVDVPVHVMHMKPGYQKGIVAAMEELDDDRIQILAHDEVLVL